MATKRYEAHYVQFYHINHYVHTKRRQTPTHNVTDQHSHPSSFTSWQAQKQIQHLRVVRRAKTRDRVPPLDGGEAVGAAARVAAVLDVVQYRGVLVQDGVDEADGLLAGVEALLIDAGDDRGEDGG